MSPLQQQRLSVGKTREQIAKEVKVDTASYGRWENGQSIPKPAKFNPLAKALGVEPATAVALVAETRRLAEQNAKTAPG